MICKKGTEVEVLVKGEEPLGSWRPARILSGNGHTYVVKYDRSPLDTTVSMNKVPRKALRPRPPHVEVKNWACADFVEVCDEGSWKLAEVLRTLALRMIVVRLMGSLKEIAASLYQIRVPLTWKDNQWIVLQKDSLKCENVDVISQSKRRKLSNQIPRPQVGVKKSKRVERFAEKYGASVVHWHLKSLRSFNEKSWECKPAFGKQKQIKKGRCYGHMEKIFTNQLFEKVDAVNSPQHFYGEKCMNSALYHETAGLSQIGTHSQIPIANAETNHVISLYLSDSESAASSVGSCSAINSVCRPFHHKASQRLELCGRIDDAESFCSSPTKTSYFSEEEEMSEAIHWLELDAYRSTLRSLYAYGSLSWNQESLLTNLRIALNISNDEHLSELKDLMTTRSE